MQFEHDTLRSSARASNRTLHDEYAVQVRRTRTEQFAGLPGPGMKPKQPTGPNELTTPSWVRREAPRSTGIRQSAQRYVPPDYSVSGLHVGAENDVWAPDKATRFETTMERVYSPPKDRTHSYAPPKYEKRTPDPFPTMEDELRHLSVTNERRVDGDRVTELVPAADWVNRSERNTFTMKKSSPPQLPRHSQRDHLSDNFRDKNVYDPAQPQHKAQVRVTRRSTQDGCSLGERNRALARDAEMEKMRGVQIKQQAARAAAEAAEANELLELHSMGIRGIMSGRPVERSPVVTRSKTVGFRESGLADPPPTPPAAAAREAQEMASAAASRAPSAVPAESDIGWVTTGPSVPLKAVKPVPKASAAPKPSFPPGAFDFLKPENQAFIKAERRLQGGATRASG